MDGLEPDLVRINQFRTLATNVELLEARDCTMTEAYELLKNIHFLDDPCSIYAYIKKATLTVPTWLLLQTPTHCCKKLNQPLLL